MTTCFPAVPVILMVFFVTGQYRHSAYKLFSDNQLRHYSSHYTLIMGGRPMPSSRTLLKTAAIFTVTVLVDVTVMQRHAKGYSDEEIHLIAEYFGSLVNKTR